MMSYDLWCDIYAGYSDVICMYAELLYFQLQGFSKIKFKKALLEASAECRTLQMYLYREPYAAIVPRV